MATYSLTSAVTELGRKSEGMWVVPASEVHREKAYSVRDAHATVTVLDDFTAQGMDQDGITQFLDTLGQSTGNQSSRSF